jgi:hypothetical protein
MNGAMEPIIDSCIAFDEEAQLKALTESSGS